MLCWDVRMTRDVLYRLPRVSDTNQRITFDIEPLGRHLATGSRDGRALLYDLNTGELATSIAGITGMEHRHASREDLMCIAVVCDFVQTQ